MCCFWDHNHQLIFFQVFVDVNEMGTSQERQGRGRLCWTWLDLECHLGPLPCVDDVDKNKCEESGKQLEQCNPFSVEATQGYTLAEPTSEHMLTSTSPGGGY